MRHRNAKGLEMHSARSTNAMRRRVKRLKIGFVALGFEGTQRCTVPGGMCINTRKGRKLKICAARNA
eukprot:1158819-Pelagomonas_calceolata.AAC.10